LSPKFINLKLVEIKSFVGQSPVTEFHKVMGQYDNYLLSLEELDPEREVWLAIPFTTWSDFFQRPFIKKVIRVKRINCLIFNHETQMVVQWIKQ
jgi:XisH protein